MTNPDSILSLFTRQEIAEAQTIVADKMPRRRAFGPDQPDTCSELDRRLVKGLALRWIGYMIQYGSGYDAADYEDLLASGEEVYVRRAVRMLGDALRSEDAA